MQQQSIKLLVIRLLTTCQFIDSINTNQHSTLPRGCGSMPSV